MRNDKKVIYLHFGVLVRLKLSLKSDGCYNTNHKVNFEPIESYSSLSNETWVGVENRGWAWQKHFKISNLENKNKLNWQPYARNRNREKRKLFVRVHKRWSTSIMELESHCWLSASILRKFADWQLFSHVSHLLYNICPLLFVQCLRQHK